MYPSRFQKTWNNTTRKKPPSFFFTINIWKQSVSSFFLWYFTDWYANQNYTSQCFVIKLGTWVYLIYSVHPSTNLQLGCLVVSQQVMNQARMTIRVSAHIHTEKRKGAFNTDRHLTLNCDSSIQASRQAIVLGPIFYCLQNHFSHGYMLLLLLQRLRESCRYPKTISGKRSTRLNILSYPTQTHYKSK